MAALEPQGQAVGASSGASVPLSQLGSAMGQGQSQKMAKSNPDKGES